MKFIIDIVKMIKRKRREREYVRDRFSEPLFPRPVNLEDRERLMKNGNYNPAKYELKFMFDYCADSCLWGENDKAFKKYGVGPIDLQTLPITDELRETLTILNDQFGDAFFFGSDNSTMSCIWTDDERAEFRERTRTACWQVKHELGPDYEVYWAVYL